MSSSDYIRDDYIYYNDKHKNRWPGYVVRTGDKRVLVRIDHEDGDKTIWVDPSNLEVQQESRIQQ